jgi:hypothetical protein
MKAGIQLWISAEFIVKSNPDKTMEIKEDE